jgi:hypothetical protein
MSLILLRSDGGFLTLPDRTSLLVSRENGGNLVVNPPVPCGSAAIVSGRAQPVCISSARPAGR